VRVIINADDLGGSRKVNGAIFQLMAAGCVTSATMLANGEAVEDAAMGAKDFAQCSFGVHLNASEFSPLTTGAGLSPILEPAGCFAGNALREVRITAALREALFHEWSAQVARVRSLGIAISHLDSHHHMHTVPGVFPVVKRVQRRFGIRKVRITMNIYPERLVVSRAHLLKKALWNFALRHVYRTVTTDGFTSLEVFLGVANKLGRRYHTVELMTHPGSSSYQPETDLLRSPAFAPLRPLLISYNGL